MKKIKVKFLRILNINLDQFKDSYHFKLADTSCLKLHLSLGNQPEQAQSTTLWFQNVFQRNTAPNTVYLIFVPRELATRNLMPVCSNKLKRALLVVDINRSFPFSMQG